MPQPGQLGDGLLVEVPEEVLVRLAGVCQSLVEGFPLDDEDGGALLRRLLGAAVNLPAEACNK